MASQAAGEMSHYEYSVCDPFDALVVFAEPGWAVHASDAAALLACAVRQA
jgi:hypothetical protein